jgi:hypothetical protein
MPQSLSSYTRRFASDEAKLRQQHMTPVLIWENPAEEKQQFLLGTQTGFASEKPKAGEPMVFEIKKGERKNAFPMGVTVGRTDNNDIALDDNSVSRFHAYFQKEAKTGVWIIVDAESKNGSWVGPVRLVANSPETVPDQSHLKFGDIELLYLEPDSFFEYLKKITDE